MPYYAVRLDVRSKGPLSAERIAGLQGGRWDITAIGRPRGRRLAISMSMEGGDVGGALIRAQNVILDQVPGEVVHAEVTATGQVPAATAGKRRRR